MPRKTKAPVVPQNVSREDWLRKQLAEIEGDVQDARDARSFQALASLHRQANATRDALDQLLSAQAAAVDATSGMADDEIVAQLVALMSVLPDFAIEQIEDAIEQRYAGRPALAVLPGGGA